MNQLDAGGRVRRFLLSILKPPDSSQTADFLSLTQEKKIKRLTEDLEVKTWRANIDSLDQMVRLNEERIQWAQRMQRHAESGCEQVWLMSQIAFGLGWLIIVVPFLLFCFSTPRDLNLLWFSGLGIAETVAILVYQPMDRVQKATSDMAQSTIIINSWATAIGLTMHLLELEVVKADGKIADTTDLINNTTLQHVRWLQLYTEKKEPKDKEKKPTDTEKDQDSGREVSGQWKNLSTDHKASEAGSNSDLIKPD